MKSRYRSESGRIIIDVAVKNARQLFDARDPAPFRERDLDDDLVEYLLNVSQEHSLATPLKVIVHFSEESEQSIDRDSIVAAFHSHFEYEADLLVGQIRKTLRTSRFFLAIGFIALSACLLAAEFVRGISDGSAIGLLLREGLVISGWVAMWRPIESILFGWWPIREQKKYCDKLAKAEIEVRSRPYAG